MKPFEVASEDRDQYVLIRADGYINNLGGEALGAESRRWLEEGRNRLILDLEKVPLINSIGVSILIEVVESVIESGGRLGFLNLNRTVERTFKIMGLLQFTEVFQDLEEAETAMR